MSIKEDLLRVAGVGVEARTVAQRKGSSRIEDVSILVDDEGRE